MGSNMSRTFHRRDFLTTSLAAGGAGAAGALKLKSARLPSSGSARVSAPAGDGRTAASAAARKVVPKVTTGPSALVVCTLYGGNDGLNVVVPYAETAYRSARGQLALTEEDVLPIGEVDGVELGLHYSLVNLERLFQAGNVAIVLGVGYPNMSLSHFVAQDIWQTADPTGNGYTGWLGRWLDKTGSDPLRALSVGDQVPPLFVGAKQVASTLEDSTSGNAQQPGGSSQFIAAYAEMQRKTSHASELAAAISASGTNLLTVARVASAALNSQSPPPQVGSVYPGDIGNQFDIVAELIKAGLPTKAYGVSDYANFDTHSDQLGQHAGMLSQLDAAVGTFMGAFPEPTSGTNPVVLIYSEFGRHLYANASAGTDHGTASSVIVVGPTVKGGFYGTYPSLTKLDDTDDLIWSTDFRSVYATLLDDVVGVDPKSFLGRNFNKLGFL